MLICRCEEGGRSLSRWLGRYDTQAHYYIDIYQRSRSGHHAGIAHSLLSVLDCQTDLQIAMKTTLTFKVTEWLEAAINVRACQNFHLHMQQPEFPLGNVKFILLQGR